MLQADKAFNGAAHRLKPMPPNYKDTARAILTAEFSSKLDSTASGTSWSVSMTETASAPA
jgi:hypothetical protein